LQVGSIHLAPNNNLSYKVGTNNADPLTVKPNELVTWKTSAARYHVTIIFKNKKTPLVDPTTTKPVNAVHGSEQDEGTLKIGGRVGQGALGHYNYSVAVFDDVTGDTYSDDPKIIVGTGFDAARDALTAALEEVEEADVASSDRRKQQEQAKSIENQLEHLLAELK
jgi:hypothetical protein